MWRLQLTRMLLHFTGPIERSPPHFMFHPDYIEVTPPMNVDHQSFHFAFCLVLRTILSVDDSAIFDDVDEEGTVLSDENQHILLLASTPEGHTTPPLQNAYNLLQLSSSVQLALLKKNKALTVEKVISTPPKSVRNSISAENNMLPVKKCSDFRGFQERIWNLDPEATSTNEGGGICCSCCNRVVIVQKIGATAQF
ncbi:hypothetical protein BT69DRAFT_1293625 [Atractiella rhizophila]|nr:hypothetical protein BT69DRAFT_1293625 [Atractiella rhizophila]